MNNGLSGWSCIYCGQELSGPEEGQDHQGTRDCRGSFSGEPEYVQAKPEIVEAIGTVSRFGYLIEDGHNVLEDHIILGGSIDEDGEVEEPHYLVTSAWREGELIMVNASLIEE